MTMRTPLLLALALLAAQANAALPPTQQASLQSHLLEVNAQWAAQGFTSQDAEGIIAFRNEAERITQHLLLVHDRLAVEFPEGLSAGQLENRSVLLSELKRYALSGTFPQNHVLSYRNPVFIDPHGTACAVGQLIIASGRSDLAERISNAMNLAYVSDMRGSKLWPEIASWAGENGFTAEELAWIQPAYSPNLPWAPMGAGTNGAVKVMLSLSNGDLLLAGDFTEAGGVPVNQVAIWDGTTFSAMGDGVDGMIKCAVEFNGEIYLGGAEFQGFNDLARWNGTAWSFSSVFAGKYPLISALHVHNNVLHAAGTLSGFAGNNDVVQRLNGSTWELIGGSFDGPILALATHNGLLMAGGAFTHLQGPPPATPVLHIAELEGNAWGQHAEGLDGTVYTLLDVNGTLYAGGDLYTNIVPNFGLARIGQGSANWEQLLPNHVNYMPLDLGPSYISSLAERNGDLYFGGKFNISPLLGEMGNHLGRFRGNADEVEALIQLDAHVNDVAVIGTNLFIGGEFAVAFPHAAMLDVTAGIVTLEPSRFSVSPNPSADEIRITASDLDLQRATIDVLDATGRVVRAPVERTTTMVRIDIRALSSGTYRVRIGYEGGAALGSFVKQ